MAAQGKGVMDALLAKSFKELALRQPIEKITIKEITDKAGVIRPTFYNHFQDKYDLLEYIVNSELLEPIEPLIENRMINEALTLLFASIEKEKEFYARAVRLEGQNSFESIIRNCSSKVLCRIIEKNWAESPKKPKFSWLTPERVADYYAYAMCYVGITWIRSGFAVSARELAEIYDYMMKQSMDDVIFGE